MMIEKLKTWWRGWLSRNWDEKYHPFPNDPNSCLVMIGGITVKPKFRSAVEMLQQFWLDHWKWIIGTAIAISGLIVHFLKK